MKIFYPLFIIIIIVLFSLNYSFAESKSKGEDLFFNTKGKFGACNHCHKNGGSAGRWDFDSEQLDKETGKKIPSLKGISERKDQDQIARMIKYMTKLFDFKLTDEEIEELTKYITTL